jgi:hypothetical protein
MADASAVTATRMVMENPALGRALLGTMILSARGRPLTAGQTALSGRCSYCSSCA